MEIRYSFQVTNSILRKKSCLQKLPHMSKSIDIRRVYQESRQTSRKASAGSAKDTGIWAILNKDIKLFGSALPDKIKESFYLELGVLLAAGVDIRGALDIIQAEQPKKKY